MFILLFIPLILSITLPFSIPKLSQPEFTANSDSNSLPFPTWLREFTGLTEWPGVDAPYIPLDFIDFDLIEPSSIHNLGECDSIFPNSCSFDCSNCVTHDDIFTCPKLSQTFDDGPTPYTADLLENLDSKTTFFTLGINIVKYPEIYNDASARGHIMGSHTWSHKFLPSLSNEQIIAQLEWSIWAMNATGNHLPKWFRPPYGGLDNRVRSIIKQFGMANVLWNFDTTDWQLLNDNTTPQEILENVETYQQTNTAGLLLEHDHSLQTVKVGLELNKKIRHQLTVPECVGGNAYLKVFH